MQHCFIVHIGVISKFVNIEFNRINLLGIVFMSGLCDVLVYILLKGYNNVTLKLDILVQQ